MVTTDESIKNDFELTDRQYNKLSNLIYNTAGINLGDNKKELVHARLCKVMRKRNISGFKEYINLLENDKTGDEQPYPGELLADKRQRRARQADDRERPHPGEAVRIVTLPFEADQESKEQRQTKPGEQNL